MSKVLRDYLNSWYDSAQGSRFSAALTIAIEPWLQGIFGYHAVQIGNLPPQSPLLESSRINHKIITDYPHGRYLCCHPEAIPIATDAVDLVVLPHSLELTTDPHAVLREAERILVPEGHLLVIGIDPWTLWGLWRRLKYDHNTLLTQSRIKDWLSILGFDYRGSQLLTMLDLHLPASFSQWPKTEQMANLLASNVAGGYAILARKRVTTVTPITPPWRSRTRLISGGMAEPAARGIRNVKSR